MRAVSPPFPVYEIASVAEGFAVQCNGVGLKTPSGAFLRLPTSPLAEAIVNEWRAQPAKINPAAMPLMQMASTTIDIVSKERLKRIDQMIATVTGELLCHRAETPPALAERQQKYWQPMLDWCTERFNAPLHVAQGIMPIRQPPQTLAALRRAVEAYDDFRLTGLSQAVGVSGSLILGLALVQKRLTAEEVFEAAELEAVFQVKQWGEDPAAAKRHQDIRRDLEICEQWFRLLDEV